MEFGKYKLDLINQIYANEILDVNYCSFCGEKIECAIHLVFTTPLISIFHLIICDKCIERKSKKHR